MELRNLIKRKRGSETQAAFGRRFKVTKQQVSNWEHGRNIPSDETLKGMGIELVYRETNHAAVVDSTGLPT